MTAIELTNVDSACFLGLSGEGVSKDMDEVSSFVRALTLVIIVFSGDIMGG